HDVGVDNGGSNRVDGDARLGNFQPETARHSLDSRLRSRVGGCAECTASALSRGRGPADNPADATLDHARKELLGYKESAGSVDLAHALPALQRRLGEGWRVADTGGVHDSSYRRKLRLKQSARLGDVFFARNVCFLCDGLHAIASHQVGN